MTEYSVISTKSNPHSSIVEWKGNTDPKITGAFVKPLAPKEAVEMQTGKKYMAVIKLDNGMSHDTIDHLSRALVLHEKRLRERGIEVTFLLTPFETSLYELEPAR